MVLDLGMGHPTNPTQPARKNPTRSDPSNAMSGHEPYFLTRNNRRAGCGPWFLTQNPTQPKKARPNPKKPDSTRKKPAPTRPWRMYGPTRPDPVLGASQAQAVICNPWSDFDLTRTRPDVCPDLRGTFIPIVASGTESPIAITYDEQWRNQQGSTTTLSFVIPSSTY